MSVTDRIPCLSPGDRAAFATSARLLSCLVTESLLRALYLPVHGSEAKGLCVILNNNVCPEPPSQLYAAQDIFAIIPLYHIPVFKHDGGDPRAKEIGLLDPLDMMPVIFEVDPNGTKAPATEVTSSPTRLVFQSHRPGVCFPQYTHLSATILKILSGPGWAMSKSTQLFTSRTPVSLWEKFGTNVGLHDLLLKEISAEFESSVKWQSRSCNHVNERYLIYFLLRVFVRAPSSDPAVHLSEHSMGAVNS